MSRIISLWGRLIEVYQSVDFFILKVRLKDGRVFNIRLIAEVSQDEREQAEG